MGGLKQIARDVLERCVDRQKSKRRVDVRQGQHDRKWAVQQEIQGMLSQMNVLQQSIKNAIATQDRFPGIGTNQIAYPQGNDHKLVEQILSSTGVE